MSKVPCVSCLKLVDDNGEQRCHWLSDVTIHCRCCKKVYPPAERPCETGVVESWV